ncbi:MAG TPA: S-layer homology domain-containing protein [Trichocoleus sp.]
MLENSRWATAGAVVVVAGLTVGTFAPLLRLQSSAAIASPEQTASFPDTQGHWAQPFIQTLAEQDIISGYPEGTFQPDSLVRRDEFAAILRQAFNQAPERQLADGSVFPDVPAGYWASNAIEEANEAGFMTGYPDGTFKPDQDISRVEALVALAQNLGLESTAEARVPTAAPAAGVASAPANAPATADPAAASGQQSNQTAPTANRQRRNTFMMPMALTTLMQPFVTPPQRRQAAVSGSGSGGGATASAPSTASNTSAAPATPSNEETPEATTSEATTAAIAEPQQLPSAVVSNQYADAPEIPLYAVEPVAAATEAGIVVNYPDPQILNPNRPATRAEIAAFIHQALVKQGRLEPLSDSTVENYVVRQNVTR